MIYPRGLCPGGIKQEAMMKIFVAAVFFLVLIGMGFLALVFWVKMQFKKTRNFITKVILDEEYNPALHDSMTRINKVETAVSEMQSRLKEIETEVQALMDGEIPDYEAAKKAAESANDLYRGIASILSYNPHTARQEAENARKAGIL